MLRRVVLGLIATWAFSGYALAKDVLVKGYVRKDGTYVAPHYRSSPNGTAADNYSTKGNVNPYTGAVGTKPNADYSPPQYSVPPPLSPPILWSQSLPPFREQPSLPAQQELPYGGSFVVDIPPVNIPLPAVSATDAHDEWLGRIEPAGWSYVTESENSARVVLSKPAANPRSASTKRIWMRSEYSDGKSASELWEVDCEQARLRLLQGTAYTLQNLKGAFQSTSGTAAWQFAVPDSIGAAYVMAACS